MPTSLLETITSLEQVFALIESEEGEPTSESIDPASETGTAQAFLQDGGVRYSEVGTVIERDRAQPLTVRKTGVRDYNLPYSPPIGQGTWKAYIAQRGGSPILFEVPFSNISMSRVVDNSAQCSLSATSDRPEFSPCAEVLSEVEPWRHELLLYRSNDIAFVGPIVTTEVSDTKARIDAHDLFYWMERRFNEQDLTFWDDIAYTFKGIFETLMEPDPSPNVGVRVQPTGIKSFKSYKGTDVTRGADMLRELARTGLDFTTIGREVYVGGKEVFSSESDVVAPLLLHDGGVSSVTVTRDGNLFATDVAVFSGSAEEDGTPRVEPLVGRNTGEDGYYGLVQHVFTELFIRDLESANANAESRRLAMSPAPLRVKATLTPDSAFTWYDLIPGRRVDTRLDQTSIKVLQPMRLVQVEIQVDEKAAGEKVTIDLTPLGISDFDIT